MSMQETIPGAFEGGHVLLLVEPWSLMLLSQKPRQILLSINWLGQRLELHDYKKQIIVNNCHDVRLVGAKDFFNCVWASVIGQ